MGDHGGQCLQVVAQNFCRDILHDGLLRQARHVLKIESVLEAFESLFDAPALMVQISEATRWKALHIQQAGHQDAYCAIGCRMAHQAHDFRLTRAHIVAGILFVRRTQRHDLLYLLYQAAAQEI